MQAGSLPLQRLSTVHAIKTSAMPQANARPSSHIHAVFLARSLSTKAISRSTTILITTSAQPHGRRITAGPILHRSVFSRRPLACRMAVADGVRHQRGRRGPRSSRLAASDRTRGFVRTVVGLNDAAAITEGGVDRALGCESHGDDVGGGAVRRDRRPGDDDTTVREDRQSRNARVVMQIDRRDAALPEGRIEIARSGGGHRRVD